MNYDYAYWAGYLSEHLRNVLADTSPDASELAADALAEFDAWCQERTSTAETRPAGR